MLQEGYIRNFRSRVKCGDHDGPCVKGRLCVKYAGHVYRAGHVGRVKCWTLLALVEVLALVTLLRCPSLRLCRSPMNPALARYCPRSGCLVCRPCCDFLSGQLGSNLALLVGGEEMSANE